MGVFVRYCGGMISLNDRIIDEPLRKALKLVKKQPDADPMEVVKEYIFSYYMEDGKRTRETMEDMWRYNEDYVAECIKAGRTLGLDPRKRSSFRERLYKDEKALVRAFAELCDEEPEYSGDYLHIAKENLFMEYDDKGEPEPSLEDWTNQFMARGYHENIVEGGFDEVMDYLEKNYRFVGRFMFTAI